MVPAPRLFAFKSVRFSPLTVGKVVGNLAPGMVPDFNSEAFKFVTCDPLKLVKFDPSNSGKVPGNLPPGIVPDDNLSAFKFVQLAPDPENKPA